MGFKYCAVLLTAQIVLVLVEGQSEWVWSKNAGGNRPSKDNSGTTGGFQNSGNYNGNNGGSSNLVPVNTVSIFGSGSSGVYNPSSNNPASPQQPAVIVQVVQPGSNNKNNDILPANSIRAVDGEARLLPHVRKLFHNALNNLVGGGNSGGGNGLGGLGGLIPQGGGSNSGFIGTLLQIGPQLAQGIGSRFPTVGPLPASSNGNEFNTQGSGSNSGNSGISFSGQRCSCVSSDTCRLPNLDQGKCNGGIMCCRRSGTRVAGDSSSSSDSTRKTRYQTSDVRAGLITNIVRGTGNIIDDTLDLILAPFLNQDDQQRLANRIANVGRRGDV